MSNILIWTNVVNCNFINVTTICWRRHRPGARRREEYMRIGTLLTITDERWQCYHIRHGQKWYQKKRLQDSSQCPTTLSGHQQYMISFLFYFFFLSLSLCFFSVGKCHIRQMRAFGIIFCPFCNAFLVSWDWRAYYFTRGRSIDIPRICFLSLKDQSLFKWHSGCTEPIICIQFS